jgi:peptide chain release factor 3
VLALDRPPSEAAPADGVEQWNGCDFFGTHNLLADALRLVDPASTTGSSSRTAATASTTRNCALLPKAAFAELHEEVEMAKGLCAPFDLEFYRAGHLTPFYFCSGLNNFGVRELLRRVGELAPAPRLQPAEPRPIPPEKPEVVGFVFKVQADIDPKHRDRIAFVGIASGRFQRGIKLRNIHRARHVSAEPSLPPRARAQPRRACPATSSPSSTTAASRSATR